MKSLNKSFFLLSCLLTLLFVSCQKNNSDLLIYEDLFWVENKGALMPVLVEGNAQSKVFIITLHGGPGGSSRLFNDAMTEMSDPLEEDFAMVYYDQRAAGNTLGNYDYETVSIEQMVEDLDLLVEILLNQYGSDISLFLLGHSWGGYLGTAYLQSGNNKEVINGWIDVDGAHNYGLMIEKSIEKMKSLSEEKIQANNKNIEEWKAIQEYCEKSDSTEINKDLFLELNGYARKTESLLAEENVIYAPQISRKEYQAIFIKDHNWLNAATNVLGIYNKTTLVDKAIKHPLSEDLSTINTPSLIIWGAHDIIVPVDLAMEAFELLGTPHKYLSIFEHSGHSPMESEPIVFVKEVKTFVDLYK